MKFYNGVMPRLIKAGDKSVLVNGRTLRVDFRIVADDLFCLMTDEIKRMEALLEERETDPHPEHTMD